MDLAKDYENTKKKIIDFALSWYLIFKITASKELVNQIFFDSWLLYQIHTYFDITISHYNMSGNQSEAK